MTIVHTDERARRAVRAFFTGYGIVLANVEDLGIQTDDGGWDHFAWTVTVRNRYWPDAPVSRKDMSGYEFLYRQGLAHTKPPTVIDLMSSLLLDASCIIDRDFEEFAEDLGYDSDSRKAEKLYQQIVENNAKLCELFRTTDLNAVLEKFEPLRNEAGL